MKYELIDPFTGRGLDEFKVFSDDVIMRIVRAYGYDAIICPNEEYFIKHFPEVICFLEEKGFIKKIEDKLVYDEDKVYCVKFDDTIVYKLGRVSDDCYNFYAINSNFGNWCENFENPQDCIENAISLGHKIDVFDSHQEMIAHYFKKEFTKQEEINLMHDLMEKYTKEDIYCSDHEIACDWMSMRRM